MAWHAPCSTARGAVLRAEGVHPCHCIEGDRSMWDPGSAGTPPVHGARNEADGVRERDGRGEVMGGGNAAKEGEEKVLLKPGNGPCEVDLSN